MWSGTPRASCCAPRRPGGLVGDTTKNCFAPTLGFGRRYSWRGRIETLSQGAHSFGRRASLLSGPRDAGHTISEGMGSRCDHLHLWILHGPGRVLELTHPTPAWSTRSGEVV